MGDSGTDIAVFPAVYDSGGAERLAVSQVGLVYCEGRSRENNAIIYEPE